ncbi:hypothetical protein [Nitrospirillum iridis]|uniref:Uncharacterized protein n=1 Tax=Nitrospirillum iridis TaxID=765888 RepID=A0A7X0B0L7_9PROT|nr:hypothetical protein [Nitrospirillum iridis]MBB6253157.1 hypothetical protein [Nitrospirillum iridis]
MPLNTITLQAAIKAAFEAAKNTAAPADPAQSNAVQEQILNQLSQDLAAAVHAYLLSADIAGITVAVVNQAQQPIGTGSQAGSVKLQ